MQKDCHLYGFRSRVFLDITTQQNEINKYQKPKRIFQTETKYVISDAKKVKN